MRIDKCLVAAALSVGIASFASADVTGSVKLDGKPPEMATINMSGVKECANQHPDPVTEETVVAGDKGELANVVISVKTDDPASLGGEMSKEKPSSHKKPACTPRTFWR